MLSSEADSTSPGSTTGAAVMTGAADELDIRGRVKRIIFNVTRIPVSVSPMGQ